MQNATNPAATQRKKNQAHKPDKRMQQQIMQPRGEEKPPFTYLIMPQTNLTILQQNATNQTHESQRKKKNLPSQICKMQHHHIQQIMHPKRKPNTQNHAIQRVGKKSS